MSLECEGLTHPHPNHGAVLVSAAGQVAGTAFHRAQGTPSVEEQVLLPHKASLCHAFRHVIGIHVVWYCVWTNVLKWVSIACKVAHRSRPLTSGHAINSETATSPDKQLQNKCVELVPTSMEPLVRYEEGSTCNTLNASWAIWGATRLTSA